MARARNIKPGFFTNEILGEADPMIGLLFVGLWCLADREGRLEDRPRKIKAEILPYRDGLDVDEMLSFLARHDFIVRYEVDDVKYIQILKFDKHQAPHHLEAPSKIPPAPGFVNRLNHAPIGVPQRRRIYERDGHKCVICSAIDHLTIDHIKPVSKGGDSSDDNLRTLCKSCNCSKGNREAPKQKHKNKMTSSNGHDDNPHVFPSDSLIPDSLIPDSLIPDSLIADSLIADSPQPSAAVRARRKRRPPAPVSEIVDLYLSNLPDLPGVVSITDKRKRHIETVHAGIMESDLGNWRGYFQAVARSPFLTGKVKDWRADFDFLIKPETPIKVLEGKYA